MQLVNAPDSGIKAPNAETQNDVNRMAVIVSALVEQGVSDKESALVDLITDALIYNRFKNGEHPYELLARATHAYVEELAEAESELDAAISELRDDTDGTIDDSAAAL